MEILLSGLQLGESPRWHDNRLWLSDWMAHEVIAVDLNGQREVIARVEAFPFCLDWLSDGQLLIVAGSDGLLLRQEGDGTLVPHADLRAISAHPWNEIVVDGRGNIYVNTIGFAFPGGEFATGYIALVTPDGSLHQVADGVAFPNGMAVTPDNKTLILAESYGNCLTAFDIADDGTLMNRRVWADCHDDHPDGICLDVEGAVWYYVSLQKIVKKRRRRLVNGLLNGLAIVLPNGLAIVLTNSIGLEIKMIIVSGRIHVRPGAQQAFVTVSTEAIIQARKTSGCHDFVVAADPLEADRINVYEEWESEEIMLAFRGEGPGQDIGDLIIKAEVSQHIVAASDPT